MLLKGFFWGFNLLGKFLSFNINVKQGQVKENYEGHSLHTSKIMISIKRAILVT